jgi:hypothetical protein
MINTLIPVSSSGKYIDKETNKESIVDFVSPVIFLLDNLTGILEEKDIIRILNSYYLNGGNFNSLSSRYKISPFKNELNKRRVNNVRMLLNKSNNFHIIEDGLDEQTKIQLAELIRALDKLASLKKKAQVIKEAAGTVTVYYASPERQLVRIPKDAVVSLNEDLAYQMGRFYPETKETWSDKDVSGKWNGGTPQPNFRAGRMPTGRPTLYKAQVNETDLAIISNMVKSVKKLRRSVNAAAVKQNIEK